MPLTEMRNGRGQKVVVLHGGKPNPSGDSCAIANAERSLKFGMATPPIVLGLGS
jgi:hypothetical protein